MALTNINVGTVANDGTGDSVRAAFQKVNANNALFSAAALSGAYSDLTGKPALATVATSGAYSDLTGKPGLAAVATSGAYSDLTGAPGLATVATSGSYSDLTSKPAITKDNGSASDPTTASDNTQGYSAGSLWMNTASGAVWVCRDASTAAAIWDPVGSQNNPGYTSGRWFSTLHSVAANNGAVAGHVYYQPFVLYRRVTLQAMGFAVTTGSSGTALLGIYSNSNGEPANLLAQLSGSLSTTTAANVTGSFTANPTLEPGFYWAASLFSGSPTMWSTYNQDQLFMQLIGGGGIAGQYVQTCGRGQTQAYASGLPASAAASDDTSQPPILNYQVA